MRIEMIIDDDINNEIDDDINNEIDN